MISYYDNAIKAGVTDHFPVADWRLIKSQLYHESKFDPKAKSSVGACGIAQFMPGTWKEVCMDMNLPGHAKPEMPEYAIPACCFYMEELYDTWRSPRPEIDRYCLALASYNAGLGNVLKAQKKANNVNDYASIISHLHFVTGAANSKQTTDYVKRILSTWVKQVTG